MRTLRVLCPSLVLLGVVACDDVLLAGWDDTADASVQDVASTDIHQEAKDVATEVAAEVGDALTEAPHDVSSDPLTDSSDDEVGADSGSECEQAGGVCLNVDPTACVTGHWASPATYACDGSVGVLCCLPGPDPLLDAGANVCDAIGGSCVSILFSTCVNAVWTQPIPFLCGADLDQGCCFTL